MYVSEKPAAPLNAGVYVRQSIQHNEGIDRATARCGALVASRGWNLVETYADNNVSASKSRADTRWADLLRDVKAGRIDVVVGVDMDRLVRSIQDLGTLIDLGVKVLTVDGEIDLTSADGEFRATMLAGIARFETRRKGERQLRANSAKLERGLPAPGRARYGFLPGNIKANPAEAATLVQVFEAVRSGVPIARVAVEAGIHRHTLRGYLTNRAYIGEIPKVVYRIEDGKRKKVSTEWHTAHEDVDRIVPLELFEDVQALLTDPARAQKGGGQTIYLASGLARCATCGGGLGSNSQNYICKVDVKHACIRKSVLDDVVKWEVFSALAGGEPREVDAGIADLLAELSALREARKLAQDMATWEGADLAEIRGKVARLGREIERVEGAVSAVRTDRVAASVVERIRVAIDDAGFTDAEGVDWWEAVWSGLSLEDQRELARILTVTVGKGRGAERVTVIAK